MTFEQFVRRCRARVDAEIATVVDPDGDVLPRIYFAHAGDAVRERLIPVEFFGSRAGKDMLAATLVEGIMINKPLFFAFLHSAYYAAREVSSLSEEQLRQLANNLLPEGMLMPSEAPDRTEILQLVALSSTGTATWQREITRGALSPPGWSDWTELKWVSGLMVEPLQQAMRA